MLRVRRDSLVRSLLAHDEDDLAKRVPSVSDEELERIGQLAGDYAFSRDHAPDYALAPEGGTSMGSSRGISLAAVEVMEGSLRPLHRKMAERRGPAAEEQALRDLGLR